MPSSHGRGRSISSGTSITTAAAATTSTTHDLHLPPQPAAAHLKHNHQNSRHHQPAPQQQCSGQGWEGIRRRRRTCGNTSRTLSRRSRKKHIQVHGGHEVTCLGTAPCAQKAVRETGNSSRTTAPTLQRERGKKYSPSRLAEGENLLAVPSRRGKHIFTVPSRREKKMFSSRVPSRKKNRCIVPSRREISYALSRSVPSRPAPPTFLCPHFTVPSCPVLFFPRRTSQNCPVPSRHDSQSL